MAGCRSPAYVVQWKSGTQGYDASRQSTGDARFLTDIITGLTNGTEYMVQVFATNANGNGAAAEATGMPTGPPVAPGNVRVTPGYVELTVTWDTPTSNGGLPITGYVVQWKSGAQGYDASRQSADDALDGDDRSYIITGLTNNPVTEYTVRVRATNDDSNAATTNDGAGPWSAEVRGTPDASLAAAPAAPGNVTVTTYNRELVVSWTAPDNRGAAITGYDVQWKSGTEEYDDPVPASTADRTIVVQDATATSSMIPTLDNGTAYTVRVRATNDVGDG